MKVAGFNHLSIGTKNLAGSVTFSETVLGIHLDRPHMKAACQGR